MEKAVKQLDVPSARPARSENRNVEITAWLVGASRAGDSGSEIPPLLRPVIGQLRERFPYQGYRLLETTSLRLRPRPRETSNISGLIPDLAVEGADPASYGFSVRLNTIQATSSGHTISVNEVTARSANSGSEVNGIVDFLANTDTNPDGSTGWQDRCGRQGRSPGSDRWHFPGPTRQRRGLAWKQRTQVRHAHLPVRFDASEPGSATPVLCGPDVTPARRRAMARNSSRAGLARSNAAAP